MNFDGEEKIETNEAPCAIEQSASFLNDNLLVLVKNADNLKNNPFCGVASLSVQFKLQLSPLSSCINLSYYVFQEQPTFFCGVFRILVKRLTMAKPASPSPLPTTQSVVDALAEAVQQCQQELRDTKSPHTLYEDAVVSIQSKIDELSRHLSLATESDDRRRLREYMVA